MHFIAEVIRNILLLFFKKKIKCALRERSLYNVVPSLLQRSLSQEIILQFRCGTI